MLITKEVDYAIRIMRCIFKSGEVPLEARKISEIEEIPMRFTFKILRKLRKFGLIRSYRGVYGGYCMEKNGDEVSVLDILESISENFGFAHCLDEALHCKKSSLCRVRKEFLEIEEDLKVRFRKLRISDIAEDSAK